MIEINPGILIAQVVTFLIALFVLWKIAWGPLTQLMKSREETVRRNIENARMEREKAEELKKSYEQQVANSHIDAQKIISQAANDGQLEREKIISTARGEAEKLVASARVQLNEEKNRLVKELRADVADLAVKISEKLIQKSIDKSVQDKVFHEMTDNLGSDTQKGNA